MVIMIRRLAASVACALVLLCAAACPVLAQGAGSAALDGTVVDAQTGLPLAGAQVVIVDRPLVRVATAADGAFHILGLLPGVYRLRVDRGGYQPAESSDLALVSGQHAGVTLALQRTAAASPLGVIGATATAASSSLQRSSTISVALPAQALVEAGVTRAGDALRELPGITNSIKGDTAALGDDIPLELRGIGALETTTALDGHPIALGFPGGYNFQLSPTAGLRDLLVTYGSGSNLLGTSAIGGIVDMRTLAPTTERQFSVAQGWGSFDKSATTLRATGTAGRLGYAVAFGVAGLDGPLRHDRLYQPGAAYDQSATDPAVRATGVYDDDSSVNSRTGLVKLSYAPEPASSLTFTALVSGYFEDKSGNGDGDYLDDAPALAFGNQLLARYKPSAYPHLAACPAGTFVATNANGQPNGFGPSGKPDGGLTCQTPQQYAAFNTGFDGAGPSTQTFAFADEHLAYQRTTAGGSFHADAFTDRYHDIVDRSYALPFVGAPGEGPQISRSDRLETEAGASIGYDHSGRSNLFGLGYGYLNLAYDLASTAGTSSSLGTPIVHETGPTLRDVYRAPGSPLTIFADAFLRHASATDTTSLDPRASVVYAPGRREALRFSAGATTTEPAGNQLGQPFVGTVLGGAGGGSAITCGGLNAIGSVPSSALHPERGVDEELAYARTFGADSQAQVSLYDTHIYDKLYATLVPLSATGSSFVDPAFLAQQLAAVAAKCGSSAAPSLLGVTGTFNVGALEARGVTLSGRQRFDRRTFLDYDWTTDSTFLVSAPAPLLKSNTTLIPGSQLPRLPLHNYDLALDRLVGRGVDLRYTFHGVSANNTKALPAYGYSDLRLALRSGSGLLSVAVDNLFDQYADIRGLRYEGVPLALNQYATAAAYAPYTGTAATERFGLPYRRIFFTYELRVR